MTQPDRSDTAPLPTSDSSNGRALKLEPTDRQVAMAASELASQEFYNPSWCKPGKTTTADDRALYRRRARLILEAALNG